MMASKQYGSMPNDENLVGACGLYCGACYHYRASFPKGERLLAEAERQGRTLQGFTCNGCRSSLLYVHPGCAECEIRACTDQKRIDHCGLCTQFPCERLWAFRNDGRIHHLDVVVQLEELAAKGPRQWLAAQASRWRCGCGTQYSWYETDCPSCGAPVNSYGPDPAAQQSRNLG
jgi:hypothetical protein